MTRRRLLLVSPTDPAAPPGGRELLYRLNHAILADLFGDGFGLFPLAKPARRSIADAWRGHIDGVDVAAVAGLCDRIVRDGITDVFLDGSNLGAAAIVVARRFPEVRIISFFHNVETLFFAAALRSGPSLRALAVLVANHRAERAAVRASSMLICLSARDGAMLGRVHARLPDAIAPIALADALPGDDGAPRSLPGDDRFLLFVGGGFFANRDGIRWFARTVAPRLSIRTVVVGHGMEAMQDELANNPAVTVIGATDDLAGWYRRAALVIAPIFAGSGMKTKVAEALMFGKHVVAAPEALSGYGDAVAAAVACCTDADGFVAAITAALDRDPPGFDPAQRALYERFHSLAAARARMARILGLAAAPASDA
jgi:glycosyltransferase involved in cell wall biosynthesis